MPKSKPQALLKPSAWGDLRRLPGNIRRRIIREINHLESNPRPPHSKRLKSKNALREIRRLRIDQWRIVYWLNEDQPVIFAIRKRPPYKYEDVEELLMGRE